MPAGDVATGPDGRAIGLVDELPDALRYDWASEDPEEVAGVLRAMMPAGVRVLDIGCGTGAVTAIVNRDKRNEVCGIEPDPARATHARTHGIEVYDGELDETFRNRHAPFDVVVLADVLEHVAAPAQLLDRAAGILKPGGLVLLSVPNVAHWTVRLSLLCGRFDYTETGIFDATHLRWFTRKTIVALCRNCGLDVLSVRQTAGDDLPEYRTVFPWKFLPGRARRRAVRWLARRLPRLFGCQHIVSARVPME
jgi:methionine biosynthesis protein MetW